MRTREDPYFEWLVKEFFRSVCTEADLRLLSFLQAKPFEVYNLRDTNRVMDAISIRNRYINESKTKTPLNKLVFFGHQNQIVCSVLELFLALAIRFEHELHIPGSDERKSVERFFWEMIRNMSLNEESERDWDDILDTFIRREYAPDGSGGPFPIQNSRKNQARVELWYQMHEYINERYPL